MNMIYSSLVAVNTIHWAPNNYIQSIIGRLGLININDNILEGHSDILTQIHTAEGLLQQSCTVTLSEDHKCASSYCQRHGTLRVQQKKGESNRSFSWLVNSDSVHAPPSNGRPPVSPDAPGLILRGHEAKPLTVVGLSLLMCIFYVCWEMSSYSCF